MAQGGGGVRQAAAGAVCAGRHGRWQVVAGGKVG